MEYRWFNRFWHYCRLLIMALMSLFDRFGVRPSVPPASGGDDGGDGGEGEGSTLGGVGSSSTSLVDYPQTGAVTTGDIWVDPAAMTNGSGTEGSPYDNLGDALTAVSDGERIIVKSGTLSLSNRIVRSTSWGTGIEIFNYGTDRPVLDFSGSSDSNGSIYFTSGGNEHWKGFEVINAPSRGVQIETSNVTIEDFHVYASEGDGIYIANFGSGAGNNLIQDCRVWKLGDGVTTGTNVPDGIVCTGNTGSPTQDNAIVRCFVANGPDDGIDLYRARGTRVVDCVVYQSGTYWNGTGSLGDGNGYKMGGNDSNSGNNYAIGCLAVDCESSGFAHNEAANTSGTDPNIVFAFCTAVDNGGSAFNTGGDNANHLNVRRDSIAWGNGSVGYVGPNATSLRILSSDPSFVDAVNSDYSLDTGSTAIDYGIEGDISNSVATQPTFGVATNAGASDVSLEIAIEWLETDLT